METWEKVVKESFRKVKTFTIYKTDELIISKKFQSLKIKTRKKVPSNFIFFN